MNSSQKIPNKCSKEEKNAFNSVIERIKTKLAHRFNPEKPWVVYMSEDEEYHAVLESLAAVARKSGWARKEVKYPLKDTLYLSRGQQEAAITLQFDTTQVSVNIKIYNSVNLSEPDSLDKIHRILKGKKRVK